MPKARDIVFLVIPVLNVPHDSGFVDGLFQVGNVRNEEIKSLEYAGLTKDIDQGLTLDVFLQLEINRQRIWATSNVLVISDEQFCILC